MNRSNSGNLIIALGVIFFGVNLIRSDGAYSWKNRIGVEFIASPTKEIVGALCIIWGVYFVYLITRTNGLCVFKLHAAVWAATLVTLVTVLCVKAAGLGILFILGFPLLIIEFALVYILGQYVQKRLGW